MSGNSDHSHHSHGHSPVIASANVNTALDLRAAGVAKVQPIAGGENNRKRTRKGRAHRYDKSQEHMRANEDDEDDEQTTVLDFSSPKHNESSNNSSHKLAPIGGYNDAKCKYCDISFPDQFLYRMHMSYHYYGDSEPFLCKCGTRTRDKVAFFIHLTTEPH
jgi:hypothetical protein